MVKARKKRTRGWCEPLEPSELAEVVGGLEIVSLDEAMDRRLREEEETGEGGWLDVVEKEG